MNGQGAHDPVQTSAEEVALIAKKLQKSVALAITEVDVSSRKVAQVLEAHTRGIDQESGLTVQDKHKRSLSLKPKHVALGQLDSL